METILEGKDIKKMSTVELQKIWDANADEEGASPVWAAKLKEIAKELAARKKKSTKNESTNMEENEDLIENLTEEQLVALALAKGEEAAAALIAEGKKDDDSDEKEDDDKSDDEDEDEDDEDLDESVVVDEESMKKFKAAVDKTEKKLAKAQDKKDDEKAAKFQKQIKEAKDFIELKESVMLSEAILAEAVSDKKKENLKGAIENHKALLKKANEKGDKEAAAVHKDWISKHTKALAEAKDEDDSDEDESDDDDKGKKGAKDGDEKDDDEEEVEEAVIVDIQEDIRLLCESEANLTDEFKQKASVIVEAAVTSRVKAERKLLEEEFQVNLQEGIDKNFAELAEKADSYLTYAVEAWMAENKVAVDSGLRTEIAESFIAGMKSLFNEHYMEVPAAKADLYETVETERDALKLQLEAKEQEASVLLEEVSKIKRETILLEESSALADTQKEKLATLCEGVEYVSEDVWRKKVTTIRDTYFRGAAAPVAESTTNPNPTASSTETIVEGAEHYAPQGNSLMTDVLAALKRTSSK